MGKYKLRISVLGKIFPTPVIMYIPLTFLWQNGIKDLSYSDMTDVWKHKKT